MAANHGDGAGAQAQTQIPAKDTGQDGAEHVLQAHHDDSHQQEGDNLLAALLQQAEAGGVTDAGEEQSHEEVLDVGVKGKLHHAGHTQSQMGQSEDQAAHHWGRDTTLFQEFNAVGQESSQDKQHHSDGCSLVHIQGNLLHVFLSPFLCITWFPSSYMKGFYTASFKLLQNPTR